LAEFVRGDLGLKKLGKFKLVEISQSMAGKVWQSVCGVKELAYTIRPSEAFPLTAPISVVFTDKAMAAGIDVSGGPLLSFAVVKEGDGDEIDSWAVVLVTNEAWNPLPHLNAYGVHRDLRGEATEFFSRRLLLRVAQQLAEAGFLALRLEALCTAVAFYSELGFRVIAPPGGLPEFLSDLPPVDIMQYISLAQFAHRASPEYKKRPGNAAVLPILTTIFQDNSEKLLQMKKSLKDCWDIPMILDLKDVFHLRINEEKQYH